MDNNIDGAFDDDAIDSRKCALFGLQIAISFDTVNGLELPGGVEVPHYSAVFR